jgi:hypothetical protein
LVLCLLQLVPAVPVAVLLLLGSLDVLPWALWVALPAQGPELLAAVRTAD